MEEKKFDPYQFIGFILIALIMTWMLMNQSAEESTGETSNDKVEAVAADQADENTVPENQAEQLQAAYGDYATMVQAQGEEKEISVENEVLSFVFSTRGGQMKQAQLKDLTNYKGEPLYLVNENQQLNLAFSTYDGRVLNTSDLNFVPKTYREKGKEVMELTAAMSESQWIQFRYELAPNDYMLQFSIQSEGLVPPTSVSKLSWELNAFRNSRSVEYENRYTELTYGYNNEKVDELSISGEDETEAENVQWIGFKQHFFSSILIPNKSLEKVELTSDNLVESEDENQVYTKAYAASFELNGGNTAHEFRWYFGPQEYKTLEKYEAGIEKSINYGWGIFGWINKSVFTPLFNFLSSFLPFGISIIIMTILVRLAMSPVTYKSYVSQIKMKVLKPEVDEINAKYPKDQVKRQQETMALYTKAGASPMSGCLPALLQLPVFYALFSFFPVAYGLRQKSFLWADDLSSYDSVLELPFSIPFYGDHVSLFPILASVAIFIYTMMTMGQQQAPQQPGMPNMKFIMYLMPLMMLFFFNNYASGLSLYYFVSNLLTIILMLVIKNFVVSEDKIFAQIEANKKKPKKAGGFTARLQKAMEEAEKQQRNKKR